ncbi:MAG TPA: hypothetical protein VGE39_05265 [Prosthecobacter sp.]
MSPPPDDNDLRAAFAQQRRADHTDAPAWRGEWLHAPASVSKPAPARRWLPLGLGTACVALAAVVWMPLPQSQPKLSTALPPLFEPVPGELFADLGPSFTVQESPSDFLLPDRLHSNLDLFNRP